MSDGNFNRNLLPYTPYQSGMKAGKAMARMKALEAFKTYLQSKENLEPEVIEKECSKFKKLLEKTII
ncbi:hypothetical protein [Bacteroides sp. OF04-15BH]|uniref:hypothetical protein n=1 Tax=Bacteroides sp. OF04-15BH TaxID=2292281 RepID=UPI000E48B01F|nr:hypothetical protein [Bacteroides sp. OF04-15BH]RHP64186.1 hypothetical protein DXA74_08380 [Bacteroides sp. OF04-15BH]